MATITEYHVVVTTSFDPANHDNSAHRDARAAAAECNRQLMDAGETGSQRAAEQQIADCDPYIARMLAIEPVQVEVDD
jgi:hypothetical protein